MWTETELAFFAAAPPDDEPAPADEPAYVDEPGRFSLLWAALRRLFARPQRPPDQPAMPRARSSSLLA